MGWICLGLPLGCRFINVGGLKCLPPCDVGNFCQGIGISVLGFEVSPPICGCLAILLGFELSYRSDMGLQCFSSGMSSMLTSFYTVIGVTSLELELLA